MVDVLWCWCEMQMWWWVDRWEESPLVVSPSSRKRREMSNKRGLSLVGKLTWHILTDITMEVLDEIYHPSRSLDGSILNHRRKWFNQSCVWVGNVLKVYYKNAHTFYWIVLLICLIIKIVIYQLIQYIFFQSFEMCKTANKTLRRNA